ncbi:MAG: hypothetical protein ACI81R_000979 [Bradymonadia bacterium]
MWQRLDGANYRAFVTVRAGGVDIGVGRLHDQDNRVLSVAFDAGPASLPIGRDVVLVLSPYRGDDTFLLNATVRTRLDEQRGSTYGFRVATIAELNALATFLRGTSNRRRAYRALPPANVDDRAILIARVRGETLERPARVLDISPSGAGVFVMRSVEEELAPSRELFVQLPFHERNEPIRVHAVIRYRYWVRDGVRYGLAFDKEADQTFEAQQDRIARHVARWQREGLTNIHRRIELA